VIAEHLGVTHTGVFVTALLRLQPQRRVASWDQQPVVAGKPRVRHQIGRPRRDFIMTAPPRAALGAHNQDVAWCDGVLHRLATLASPRPIRNQVPAFNHAIRPHRASQRMVIGHAESPMS
jgi:hypothetical protein